MNRVKLGTAILLVLLVGWALVSNGRSLPATTTTASVVFEDLGLNDLVGGGERSTHQSSTTTTTIVLSEGPAWIASKKLERAMRAEFDADDRWHSAYAAALRDFYGSNPNTLTSPMGTLCWAHHELYRTLFLHTEYGLFHYMMIPSVMHGAGLSETDITPSLGTREASSAVINLLDARKTAGTLDFEDSDGLIRALRTWNGFVGTGSDWLTAIRTVATSEEFASTTLPTGGLPDNVRVYAAALLSLVKAQSTAESPSLEIDTLLGLAGYDAFHSAAKTSSNCQRIRMDVRDEVLNDDKSTTTTAATTTSTSVSSTEGRPGVPRDVSIASSVVSWLPPDTGGPVENYAVRIVFVLSGGRGLFQHTEVTSSLTFDATSLISTHGTDYSVKILAFNPDGRSRWTRWVRPRTPTTISSSTTAPSTTTTASSTTTTALSTTTTAPFHHDDGALHYVDGAL